MSNRMDGPHFKPQDEKHGILHPSTCACVRCTAGRKSHELGGELRDRLLKSLDDTFIDAIKGAYLGGFQMLAQGQDISQIRAGFLGHMANALRMREMAAAYFAEETAE